MRKYKPGDKVTIRKDIPLSQWMDIDLEHTYESLEGRTFTILEQRDLHVPSYEQHGDLYTFKEIYSIIPGKFLHPANKVPANELISW